MDGLAKGKGEVSPLALPFPDPRTCKRACKHRPTAWGHHAISGKERGKDKGGLKGEVQGDSFTSMKEGVGSSSSSAVASSVMRPLLGIPAWDICRPDADGRGLGLLLKLAGGNALGVNEPARKIRLSLLVFDRLPMPADNRLHRHLPNQPTADMKLPKNSR